MRTKVLPEFQNCLRSKSLCKAKHITYYAHWARKFLAFSKSNGNLSRDVLIQKFLDYLKNERNDSMKRVANYFSAISSFFDYIFGNFGSDR